MTAPGLARLWLIVDRGHQPDDGGLFARLAAMAPLLTEAAGDVGVIERDHTGTSDRARLERLERLAAFAIACGAPLWVNRRADLALAVGAAGVVAMGASIDAETLQTHFTGIDCAASCHNGAELARAEAAHARFALLAPIFNPTSKPPERPPLGLEGLRALAGDVRLPVVALGGLDASHVRGALGAGAHGVAVLGAILGAADPAAALGAALAALRAPR